MKIIMRNIDASNITDMKCMFKLCKSIETLDLSSFDTGKVESMHSMFNNCSSLKTLDISSFDTRKVTNMNSMFSYCHSLEKVILPKDKNSIERLINQLKRDNIHCEVL